VTSTAQAARGTWSREGTDLARAASGALLLGVPLVYTNEVWRLGHATDPTRALVVLAVTYLLLLALNRTSGFRDDAPVRLRDAAGDAVEGLAVGVTVAGALMLVIGQVSLDTPLRAALATVAYEAVPCALGVGLARHLLRDRGDDAADDDDDDDRQGDRGDRHPPARAGRHHGRQDGAVAGTLLDLGATALGALVIALSVAPTQEVLQVAAAMSPTRLLLLVGASLATSYVIVFVAGFSDQEHRRNHKGVLQRPLSETVAAYLVSLAVSALMLVFFEVDDRSTPRDELLTMVMALGLPACIGGAAGRLAA
jgi:putative integral membrane protein (TIGR02587 family)